LRKDFTALVFDKDGTLFDFHATWGAWSADFIEGLAEGDPVRRDVLADAMGYDLPTGAFRRSSPVIAETVDVLVAIIHAALPDMEAGALRARILETSSRAPQVEATALVPLFARLRAEGYKLGLATNDGEGPARAHLERAGIARSFDFVAGYDSGHGGKPGPGMLRAFCAATGSDPGRTVMIGDSTHDLVAGRAAGMATVGVLTGPAVREDLAPHADAVMADIAALPGWLGLPEPA
jgi:phosphoglycolate phosphatase